jgi:hypothetical protein
MKRAHLFIALFTMSGCRSRSWDKSDWVCYLPSRAAPSIRAYANKAGVRYVLYRSSDDVYVETEIETDALGEVVGLLEKEIGISSIIVRERPLDHRVHIQYVTKSEPQESDRGGSLQVAEEVECHEGKL